MTEAEYVEEFKNRWPRMAANEASNDTLQLADAAVQAFPLSARLWDIRGDLIQFGPESMPQPLEDALASYQRAVAVDPEFATAWDSIGHYYDVHLDNEVAARRHFARAAWLRRHGERAT